MHAQAVHGCCEAPTAHRLPHAAMECCGMVRRYATKAERREALEFYRDQLKSELVGVEERLEGLAA